MKKNLEIKYSNKDECFVERALEILGGKWTFVILKNLFEGDKRFGELRKALHNISPRTLTLILKNLETHNIITRTVYPVIPLKVVYGLTDSGRALENIVVDIQKWGEKYIQIEK